MRYHHAALLLCLLSSACSTTAPSVAEQIDQLPRDTEPSPRKQTANRYNNDFPFLKHANPGVRYAAHAGGKVGFVAGAGVSVAALPVALPMAVTGVGGDLVPEAILAGPIVLGMVGGAGLFGGIMWPFFGWWSPDSDTGA